MNFLRKVTKNDGLDALSQEEKQLHLHFSQVCDEMPDTWEICKIIAVHDPSLPIVYEVISRLSIHIGKVIEHLEKNGIIRWVTKLNSNGVIVGGWFKLANPVYGTIIIKRITNEEYYSAVFKALEAIDQRIQFRQFDENTKLQILSPYSTALPQAIHVWKEALKYGFDDIIEHFWNVPLDIMKRHERLNFYLNYKFQT